MKHLSGVIKTVYTKMIEDGNSENMARFPGLWEVLLPHLWRNRAGFTLACANDVVSKSKQQNKVTSSHLINKSETRIIKLHLYTDAAVTTVCVRPVMYQDLQRINYGSRRRSTLVTLFTWILRG